MLSCEHSVFRAATVDVGPFLFELQTRTVLIGEWHPAQASLFIPYAVLLPPLLYVLLSGRKTVFVFCTVYRKHAEITTYKDSSSITAVARTIKSRTYILREPRTRVIFSRSHDRCRGRIRMRKTQKPSAGPPTACLQQRGGSNSLPSRP